MWSFTKIWFHEKSYLFIAAARAQQVCSVHVWKLRKFLSKISWKWRFYKRNYKIIDLTNFFGECQFVIFPHCGAWRLDFWWMFDSTNIVKHELSILTCLFWSISFRSCLISTLTSIWLKKRTNLLPSIWFVFIFFWKFESTE